MQLYVAGKVYFYEITVEFVDADIVFGVDHLGWLCFDRLLDIIASQLDDICAVDLPYPISFIIQPLTDFIPQLLLIVVGLHSTINSLIKSINQALLINRNGYLISS